MGLSPSRNGNRGTAVLPYLQFGVEDPTVVPTAGSPGMIYFRIPNDGSPPTAIGIYQKISTQGEDTNWQLVGSGGGGGTFQQQSFILSALDIANGYVDLANVAQHASVIPLLEGAGVLMEGAGFDYTLSDVVTTRLTFDPTLIPFLAVGQKLQVQYVF